MKQVIFIGQAPAKPSSRNAAAGNYLDPWLKMVGFTDSDISDHFKFLALTAKYPGDGAAGHLKPTAKEIKAYRPKLINEIQSHQPDVIVPVGSMAINALIPEAVDGLVGIIGNKYSVNPFDCLPSQVDVVPLPHPSGKSTWVNDNSDLLVQALAELYECIQA